MRGKRCRLFEEQVVKVVADLAPHLEESRNPGRDRPTFAPLRSMTVLVTSVVPCTRASTSRASRLPQQPLEAFDDRQARVPRGGQPFAEKISER